MMQFDPTTGTLVLPVWASAAAAAVLVALALLAVWRAGALRVVAVLVVLAALGYAGWIGSSVLDRIANGHRVDELRSFEARAHDLLARALLPGSPLSCLDNGAGEQVALSCERVLFGSPENVASAVAYVTARISLMIDGLDAASRDGDDRYEGVLHMLRRGLDSDPYGIVAHVFLQQPNCEPESCEMLSLLRDPNKVRVNLQDKTFDMVVARNAVHWTQSSGGSPQADAAKGDASSPIAGASAPAGAPVASKYDFPSADSIPPVSIMNAEPSRPPAAASGSTAAAPAPKPAPRRSSPSARTPARQTAQGAPAPAPRQTTQGAPAPVQLAPSAQAGNEAKTAR